MLYTASIRMEMVLSISGQRFIRFFPSFFLCMIFFIIQFSFLFCCLSSVCTFCNYMYRSIVSMQLFISIFTFTTAATFTVISFMYIFNAEAQRISILRNALVLLFLFIYTRSQKVKFL